MSAAYNKGRLVEGSHFIIKNIGKGAKFSKNRKRISITEEDGVTEYIMLELESCIEIANAQRIKRREQPLRDNAIMRFLENASEHIGKTVDPICFAILDDNNRLVKRSFVNSNQRSVAFVRSISWTGLSPLIMAWSRTSMALISAPTI